MRARVGINGVAKIVAMLVATATLGAPTAARADDEALLDACYQAVNATSSTTPDAACALCQTAVDRTSGKIRLAALINLGRCEQNRGKLLRARALFREARSALADDDPRAAGIDTRLAELDGRIGTLALDWTGAPEATVTLDDEALSGKPATVEVDPGDHRLVVVREGHEDNELTTDVAEGATVSLTLAPGPALAVPEPAGLHEQEIAGLVVGAVGVAGFIGFGITGGLALAEQSTFEERCPPDAAGIRRCLDAEGVAAADRGETLVIINAVTLGVGAAGVAVGLILFLTAPDAAADDAKLSAWSLAPGPGTLGLSMRHRF